MILSLWSVPLVLRALGESDYGLYNLVAGVIAMLAFLNSSMTVVTQRFMSVTMGEKNVEKLNSVYNAGIRIHIALGIILVVLLEALSPFLFNGFLNILPDRIEAAKLIYQFMIVSTFFSIMSVPFDATLNAYENMLVFAIIEVLGAMARIGLAFLLFNATIDRLVFYGLGIAVIHIMEALARVTIVYMKYTDLKVSFRLQIRKSLFNEMLSYAGWNTFGSLAMVCKNQGMAIILNIFRGTAINAAYGIANQVNGAISSFTANIQKAVSPQLMQREGAKERESMFEMSFSLVKIATVIFALMAVPMIMEINQILNLWLGENIPEYTAVFCQLIILTQLLFQLSSGVALTIDAVGNIGFYRLVLSIVILFNIPFAYFLLKSGYPPYAVLFSMVIIEICCLSVRLFFAHKNGGFPIGAYFRECAVPLILVISLSCISSWIVTHLINESFCRFVLTTVITAVMTSAGTYFFVFSNKEQMIVISFIKLIVKRK